MARKVGQALGFIIHAYRLIQAALLVKDHCPLPRGLASRDDSHPFI